MKKENITELLPSCCHVGFLSINNCSDEERVSVQELLSCTNTIIVLAHHIKSYLEWAWFPLESERNNNTCGADLHTKNILQNIESFLKSKDFSSCIVPYPGISGIRMKEIADKTNLGSIGDNYMFLHPEWGSWTHLRVLLTDAKIEEKRQSKQDACIHCGKCLSACPANAIQKNTFNGIACKDYQMVMANGIKDSYFWKCEVCARVCPIGQAPSQIKITKSETEENMHEFIN